MGTEPTAPATWFLGKVSGYHTYQTSSGLSLGSLFLLFLKNLHYAPDLSGDGSVEKWRCQQEKSLSNKQWTKEMMCDSFINSSLDYPYIDHLVTTYHSFIHLALRWNTDGI